MFPVDFVFAADECDYGLFVGFGGYDEHLFAEVDDCVACGDDGLAVFEHAGDYEVVFDAAGDVDELFAVEAVVLHFDGVDYGLDDGVGAVFCFELASFGVEVDVADVAYEDDGADDAEYSEGVGAGVAEGDVGAAIAEFGGYLGSGSEGGGVGYGTAHYADHHRDFYFASEEEEGSDCDGYVQYDDAYCYEVHRYAAFFEGGEERGAYLESDAEYEQDESEFLDEVEYLFDVSVDCGACGVYVYAVCFEYVADCDAHEEYEGYSE